MHGTLTHVQNCSNFLK